MGRLSDRLGLFSNREEIEAPEEYYEEEYAPEEYYDEKEEEYEKQIEDDEEEKSYDDVPIKLARQIKRKPTPKGYFRTVLFGIPVDLHALENYIVRTSPFAIKTLMRYDNSRIIEEIKQYGTTSTGKKKLDAKFFFFLIFLIIIVVVGIILMLKGPEIMNMFKMGV